MTKRDWINLSAAIVTVVIFLATVLYAMGRTSQNIDHLEALELKTEAHVERIDQNVDTLAEEFAEFRGEIRGYLEAQRLYINNAGNDALGLMK